MLIWSCLPTRESASLSTDKRCSRQSAAPYCSKRRLGRQGSAIATFGTLDDSLAYFHRRSTAVI